MNQANLNPAVQAMRLRITVIGRMLFERLLTDAAGGNISARVKTSDGDFVCLTSSFCGQKYQWAIQPEQVLVLDLAGNRIAGEGALSRESQVHLKLLNEFPDGNAVIHAHPRNALVFCAARQPIPPVLESNLKFGTINVVPFAAAHTAELATHVAAGIRGQEARIRKQAAAVLAPWHGVFCIGRDLDAAFDAVERIDINARILLMGRALGEVAANDFANERAALNAAMAQE